MFHNSHYAVFSLVFSDKIYPILRNSHRGGHESQAQIPTSIQEHSTERSVATVLRAIRDTYHSHVMCRH